MTEKKEVAKTHKNVLDHGVMQKVLDRGIHPDLIISEVSNWWVYDLYKRKPAPALRDGVFVGTDLDLACFLSTLAYRHAHVNIPFYKSMRPKTITEGIKVVSEGNRNGPILSLVSNKEVFSFGLRINDDNVIEDGVRGVPRSFSVTAPDGNWYEGWKTIQWDPTRSENSFLNENELFTGNRLVFKDFVHPARWQTFYGHHYFITKVLIERLTEQAKDNFAQMKRMISEGIEYPETEEEGKPKDWGKSMKADGKSVKFKSLEVHIDVPDYNDSYPKVESSQENLVRLTKERRLWNYTIVPNLRFATRITEFAFMKHDTGRIPTWLKNCTWESDYVQKGKKIKWDRLVLFQPGPGEVGVSIRKREKYKSEIMAKDYVYNE